MEDISQFKRLYGEKNTAPAADYIFSESLESRSEGFNWKIARHIHPDLHQIFYVTKGSLDLLVDEGTRRLLSPVIISIPLGVIHGFNFEPGTTGQIISIINAYYEDLVGDLKQYFTISDQITIIEKDLLHGTMRNLPELMATMDSELLLRQVGKNLMLRACMQQLFLLIYRHIQSTSVQPVLKNNAAGRHFERFKYELGKKKEITSVEKIASKLAISPVHLNRICNSLVGKSAGQLIQEHLLTEAKKYLMYSTLPISQIAYQLNFEYPNYFARFFRKYTGLTPKEFRISRTQDVS